MVGRSNIVGKPIANMMLQKAPGANATVTVCHTATRDMAAHTRRADILIVAAGCPTPSPPNGQAGRVVIDVGVNRIGMTPEGKAKLVGDVDFDGGQGGRRDHARPRRRRPDDDHDAHAQHGKGG